MCDAFGRLRASVLERVVPHTTSDGRTRGGTAPPECSGRLPPFEETRGHRGHRCQVRRSDLMLTRRTCPPNTTEAS